jgi:hypothetical protein
MTLPIDILTIPFGYAFEESEEGGAASPREHPMSESLALEADGEASPPEQALDEGLLGRMNERFDEHLMPR